MDGDELELGGTSGRRIQRRAPRGSLKAKPKRKSFTPKRRQAFLDHFAASCNARAAARAVGVSEFCVYSWRKKDPQFREGWKLALDQGYARLEAESVRESIRTLKARPRKDAAVKVGSMDAKTALAVLDGYRRSVARNAGEVRPMAYDVEAVARRLEAKMRALGVLGAGSSSGGAEEGPSTATRSPSPATAGEET